MGSLTLPAGGKVYVDTPVVVYTVQMHPVYAPLCRPLWEEAQAENLSVVSSELTLLEALVRPIRDQDVALQQDFEAVLFGTELILHPITRELLREAARLRALIPGLRTPDAVHTATGLLQQCDLFLTNDRRLQRPTGLNVLVLDDLLR